MKQFLVTEQGGDIDRTFVVEAADELVARRMLIELGIKAQITGTVDGVVRSRDGHAEGVIHVTTRGVTKREVRVLTWTCPACRRAQVMELLDGERPTSVICSYDRVITRLLILRRGSGDQV